MSRRHRPWIALVIVCAGPSLSPVSAHPMPNTVIAVSVRDDGVRFDVAVPLSELRLALPGAIAKTADLLAEPQRSAVMAYFAAHGSVQSNGGPAQPVVVHAIAVRETREDNVGVYQELRVQMFAAANAGFDPRDFTLKYDAVIHQVPNHYALVQVVGAGDAGVIHFDFARNETASLRITAPPARVWSGFPAGLHTIRVGTMICAALLASLWLLGRALARAL